MDCRLVNLIPAILDYFHQRFSPILCTVNVLLLQNALHQEDGHAYYYANTMPGACLACMKTLNMSHELAAIIDIGSPTSSKREHGWCLTSPNIAEARINKWQFQFLG